MRFTKDAFHVQIYESSTTPKTALNVSLYVHSLYFNLELVYFSIANINYFLIQIFESTYTVIRYFNLFKKIYFLHFNNAM